MAESNIGDEDIEITPGYKPPEPKSCADILSQDQDDVSLQRYKQQLLGDAAALNLSAGGKKVVVEKLSVLVDGRPDLVLDLTCDLKKLKDTPVVLKEGCSYKLKITFSVTGEIVPGLKFHSKIQRKGIPVDKVNYMVGSYGPKAEPHSFIGPSEDAPTGMISRGKYLCKSTFLDDDKDIFLEWDWVFEIKKHWPDEGT